MIIDRRFQFLTSKQREIAEMAKEKGFITLGTVKMFYSSREHWERALEKLIAFGILIPNKNSEEGNILFKKFKYNPYPEIDNIQKTLEVKQAPLTSQILDNTKDEGAPTSQTSNELNTANKEKLLLHKIQQRKKALSIIENPGQE